MGTYDDPRVMSYLYVIVHKSSSCFGPMDPTWYHVLHRRGITDDRNRSPYSRIGEEDFELRPCLALVMWLLVHLIGPCVIVAWVEAPFGPGDQCAVSCVENVLHLVTKVGIFADSEDVDTIQRTKRCSNVLKRIVPRIGQSTRSQECRIIALRGHLWSARAVWTQLNDFTWCCPVCPPLE